MKLFQTSNGCIIAFGFDMLARRPDPTMICWNDPTSGGWEPDAANAAGFVRLSFEVAPEFVRDCGGVVVAYQPGVCIEMIPITESPWVWSIRTLRPGEHP